MFQVRGAAGAVVAGRIATGTLRVGMQVVVSPRGVVAEVASVEVYHKSVPAAGAGDMVGVALR